MNVTEIILSRFQIFNLKQIQFRLETADPAGGSLRTWICNGERERKGEREGEGKGIGKRREGEGSIEGGVGGRGKGREERG